MKKLTKEDMVVDPIPCHQCITLSICKAKLAPFCIPPVFMTFLYAETSSLGEKCSMLYAYMKPYDHYDYNIYHRRLAVHYLTGVDLGGDMPYGSYTMKELYQRLNMMEEYKHET